MTRTLILPDGRRVSTTSAKRWHVVVEHPPGTLIRLTSSDTRERALARWRDARRRRQTWLIDATTGNVERTPDSPSL